MKCRPSIVPLRDGGNLALAQAQLHDVGALGAEAGLAIAEVEPPQAPEALVEAKALDLVPGRFEAAGPFGQGLGVVLAEPLDAPPLQPGPRRLLLQPGLGGQHAAREDVLLDEVGAAAVV